MTPSPAPVRPFLLLILDGLALNPASRGDAVEAADTPTLSRLLSKYPTTTLTTFGPRVGLPEGQMGNSEVGHLNIGGGRIVQQELTRINLAIEDRALAKLPTLNDAFGELSGSPGSALHLVGLVSRGGVHSSLEHLTALIDSALEAGVKNLFIHVITDGRDRPPTASLEEVGALVEHLKNCKERFPGVRSLGIASIVGRYFSMDRDNRWERTELGYRLMTEGLGEAFVEPLEAILSHHQLEQTDEFLKPLASSPGSFERTPWITDGDSVLFFNFRADRMRQIVRTFFDPGFESFLRVVRPKLQRIMTLTEYDADFPVKVLFAPQIVKNHLGEVIAANGLRQLRIAETEKYAHVTYFFNGGNEDPSENEERVLVPSPRDVPTYDLKPEMSAREVTEAIVSRLEEGRTDVYIVNFANCDMVGHTGSFDAAVKAVETVDECVGRILAVTQRQGGRAIVTADHGNADQMVDYVTGEPHTFHTMHPVPLILFGDGVESTKLRSGGALCDIAPTICQLLDIAQPPEMTGRSLIE